jgi:serine/threonine-protein kinase
MDAASSERRLAIGTIVANRLRIVRCLGAGGMGVVYEVEHEITHHRRALKLLHSSLAQVPDVVERFLREASVAGRIGSPHIVETFDAGKLETGEPYIVMELLRGETLAERLQRSGPLPVDLARQILAQACQGVDAAHSMGIIHRDLKPENLFLTTAGETFVKILDFGISKFDATTGVSGLTLEGAPMGTPYYMSPEQVRGDSTIDARTDVYALGVVLYECLTGRKPFVADSLPRLIVLIHEGRYEAPSSVRPDLGKEWDTLVAQALALDRGQRFPSAPELARAIAQTGQSLAPVTIVGAQRPAPSLHSPAITPDVFSRPLEGRARSRQRGLRTVAGVGLTIAAAATVAVFLQHRSRSDSESERAAASQPGLDVTKVAPALERAAASPPPEVALAQNPEAPDARAATSPTTSGIPQPNALEAAPPTHAATARPTARASAPSAAAQLPNVRSAPGASAQTPSAASPKSRAANYGLSESNPFQ